MAEKAGFCSGVARAVKLLLAEAENKGPGSTLGPLVHNEEVVQYLKRHHIEEAENPAQIKGNFVAVRTHGVTPALLASLKKLENIFLLDLTCSRVRRVQQIAADLQNKGYNIYIFGHKEHPEVMGIKGWAGEKAVVFSTFEELQALNINEPAALIAQTTAEETVYNKVAAFFKKNVPAALVFDTLCPETRFRLEAAAKLAERVDALIVVGSKTSANTKALFNSCRQLKPTCWINSIRELEPSFIEKYEVVGITAGASTPPWTIKEAVDSMENENNNETREEQAEVNEEMSGVTAGFEEAAAQEDSPGAEEASAPLEVQAETQAAQGAEEQVSEEQAAEETGAEAEALEEPAAEEQVAEEQVAEEQVAEEQVAVEQGAEAAEVFHYDTEVKIAQVGEEVTGKVARVTGEEVYVDIGAKSEAILPVAEVHVPEGKTLNDLFSPEDDIEVTVFDIDEHEAKVYVSHKRLARENRLKELEEAHTENLALEAPVKQVVGAGMLIDLGQGLEGFMPGSLVDLRYIPDFSEFKGQMVSFKIIELDRTKGKLILSRKVVLEEAAEIAKHETLKAIEVGSVIKGTVKRLTDFGAFVDIGGIDGLVHISELSWERVNHPSEVLKVGEEIEVKVLEVIPERERVSLSIRKTQPDPWTKAAQELEKGSIVTGRVTRLVNFGAFIELKPGVEGLAHISQLADFHVQQPSEVLSEGEEVEVKIIDIKAKSKRISLSVKEAGGVIASPAEQVTENNESGNVTLGDVFGELFENGNFQAEEEPAVSAEDKVAEAPAAAEAETEPPAEEIQAAEEAETEPVAEEPTQEEAGAKDNTEGQDECTG